MIRCRITLSLSICSLIFIYGCQTIQTDPKEHVPITVVANHLNSDLESFTLKQFNCRGIHSSSKPEHQVRGEWEYWYFQVSLIAPKDHWEGLIHYDCLVRKQKEENWTKANLYLNPEDDILKLDNKSLKLELKKFEKVGGGALLIPLEYK